METWLLALDFGGTKHTAAAIRLEDLQTGGTWQAHERSYSPPGATVEDDLQAMSTLGHRVLQGLTPAVIGVSFGGPVDAPAGIVRLSHHVPGWENYPLAAWLEQEFGAQVRVDNDANVAALGEHRFGAGRGKENLLYITVSTGVGGGWILNGKIWQGSDGMAGEIGHMVVDPQGPVCLCGKRGCVERLASGPYMAQDARDQLAAEPSKGQVLMDLVQGNLPAIDGRAISRAAASGDPLAGALLKRSAWALGVAIGNAANLVNPQRFVLGGGVTKSGAGYWAMIHEVARATALPEVNFDILPAALGDDAPVWGAIVLAESALPVF